MAPAVSAAPRHWAEALARRALERRGWVTLAANARVAGGELDLVMDDGESLVFVEVRQRAGRGAAESAAESLGTVKRARVRRAAAAWLARHGGHDRAVRFDAVLVHGGRSAPRLRWVRDAF